MGPKTSLINVFHQVLVIRSSFADFESRTVLLM